MYMWPTDWHKDIALSVCLSQKVFIWGFFQKPPNVKNEETKSFHQSAVMNNSKIKRIIPNAGEPDETANER